MTLTINNSERKYKIHPKMFLLYLSMASMIMLFSAFSSALIVKKGDALHWQEVILPSIFSFSTIVIIFSSVSLQFAWKNIEKSSLFKSFGYISIVLSILFIVMQYKGWSDLKMAGVLYTGNPSGSFIYFISALHIFHYAFGIFFLVKLVLFQKKNAENFKLYFKMLTHYWHFIGIVWVYLFILFKFIIYK